MPIQARDDNGAWMGAPIATFTDTGRVGIGTTSPQQALDVAGTVRTTGILLGGDMLLSGGIKDSTGQYTRVDQINADYWVRFAVDRPKAIAT